MLKDDLGNSAEAVKTISLQPSFGIDETNKHSFLVFPNPATECITVQFPFDVESFDLRISDIYGRITYKKEFPAENNLSEVKLSVGGMDVGVYLVNFISENIILYSDILIILF